MPLLTPVIQAARLRGEQMRTAMGYAQIATWRSMLAPRWLPLPHVARPSHPAGRTVNVAVDGTSHTVQLHNGAHFVLAVAAAYGPEYCRNEQADMEILPARFDEVAAATARDLLMRSLEAISASCAADALIDKGQADRGILWIDGSLYADLSHMAGVPDRPRAAERVQWGSTLDRARELLDTTAALLDRAERAGLWVMGIGKTQRAGFLFDALDAAAHGPRPSMHAPHLASDADVSGGHPADGELLASMSVGWSWPLVLDGSRFPVTSKLAAARLRDCPAIVSTYIRPHAADLPLRLDVPASLIGLNDRLLGQREGSDSVGRNGSMAESGRTWPAWVPDPEAMRPMVEAALAAYGGISVYNAPLYAVDRIVRLPRRELELRYLPICERIAGLNPGSLGINRGRRRFIMS